MFPIHFILDLIFPRRCLACRGFCGKTLCPDCYAKFPFCRPGLQAVFPTPVFALGRYEGMLHDLVGRMKFKQEERIAAILGRWLGARLVAEGVEPDLVIPVPLHPKRLRRRGFNQAVVMAGEIGRSLKRPCEKFLLTRVRETVPQTGLSREARGENLRNAFELQPRGLVEGKKVLLVDDVYTTGATVKGCADLLLEAGVAEVQVGVAARTP